MLSGKTIVLGITGGIAAYKAVQLCSMLVKSGAVVRVIMTRSAAKFVSELTLQTISRNPVATDTFDERDPSVVSHIDLADRADLVVIAPATANVIGKYAHGIADDMLTTTLLAATAPVLVAPAMNVHMYAHPAVQDNMALLRKRGVLFIEPGTGPLACGYVGQGRLAEPDLIFARIVELLKPDRPLAGKRVLVTAGATVERIDPVRYLTNDSSGKMGTAIAAAARDLGAEVLLIAGKMQAAYPEGVSIVQAESAQNMFDAVMEHMDDMDVIIKAAAVADYRPVQVSPTKIKKSEASLQLTLEKTPDILQAVGERKKGQFVVGFAAETHEIKQHALDKLQRKRCDLLVVNDVTQAGAGFGTDTNIVTIYGADGTEISLPLLSKQEVAHRLLQMVAERLAAPGNSG
jgi:phosphopantothenoylcysteine decarboxylase/phosphopantothenate--cysteine ligase